METKGLKDGGGLIKYMVRIPEQLNEALKAIAFENKLKLSHNTHYNAVNAELRFTYGNLIKRINCEVVNNMVHVVAYIEIFPFFPILLRWCQNNIPMFPFLAKIKWKRVAKLPVSETKGFYQEKIVNLLEILKNAIPNNFN